MANSQAITFVHRVTSTSYNKPLHQSEAWCTSINENEFNLHVNAVSFSYERMGTNARFEKERWGNSEIILANDFKRYIFTFWD